MVSSRLKTEWTLPGSRCVHCRTCTMTPLTSSEHARLHVRVRSYVLKRLRAAVRQSTVRARTPRAHSHVRALACAFMRAFVFV
eukprot:6210414-Pleurochrysis_carterae.AAC.6